MNDEMLTTKQVAEKLGITTGRVWALIKAGRLPSQQMGRDHIIKESDLALVAERKPGRPKKDVTLSEAAIKAANKLMKPKVTSAQKKAIKDEQQRRWRNEKPATKKA
jgi:excisionase family DNA binding protein